MCCTRLAGNAGPKIAKNSPSGHHCTTLLGCIFATGHVSTIGKKVCNQQYLLHMSSQYGELRPTSGRLRSIDGFGAPQQISTAFASWFRYCSDVAQWKPTKLCTMFGRLLAGRLFIHFRRLLLRNRILPGAKFTLRPPSLALANIGSVTARHSSSGREPNFAALNRGRQLYSAGRPSRWALAHISSFSIYTASNGITIITALLLSE